MLTPFETETYWQYFERLMASQTESEIQDWYECAIALLKQVQERQQHGYHLYPKNKQQSA